MEPFAFIVCAPLCLIQPPMEGQSRETCLARMEASRKAEPDTRVICESLDIPYGDVIDSAGIWKPRTPYWERPAAAAARGGDAATLTVQVTRPDGRLRTTEKGFPSVLACEAFLDSAMQRKPDGMTVLSHGCRRHYRTAPER